MIRKTFLAAAATAAVMTIGGAGSGWAGPVLQFSALSTGTPGFAASAGWSFITNEAVKVTALDAFDPTGTGAGGVRLYTASGTVLASAKVTTSDPKQGSPISFYSAAITPVSLKADMTYYIAEDLGSTTTANGNVTGLMTVSAIKYGSEVAAAGQGMDPTTDATMGMFSPGIFGPNFDIAAVGASVPEPGSFALLGIGLLGLLGGMIRQRRQSSSA
jgi:hypothetical protein